MQRGSLRLPTLCRASHRTTWHGCTRSLFPRTPEPLALGSRPLQSGQHALANTLPLELSDHPENLHLQPLRRRRGIDPVGVAFVSLDRHLVVDLMRPVGDVGSVGWAAILESRRWHMVQRGHSTAVNV